MNPALLKSRIHKIQLSESRDTEKRLGELSADEQQEFWAKCAAAIQGVGDSLKQSLRDAHLPSDVADAIKVVLFDHDPSIVLEPDATFDQIPIGTLQELIHTYAARQRSRAAFSAAGIAKPVADSFAAIETKLRSIAIQPLPLALVRFCWDRQSVSLIDLSPMVWRDGPPSRTVASKAVSQANAAMGKAKLSRTLSRSGDRIFWNS